MRPFRHIMAGVAAVGLTAAALAVAGPESSRAAAPPPLPLASLFGGPFTLTDHNGQQRTDKDYRGKFMLIYFGYTYCPTICPTNLQHMALALKKLGPKAKSVQPLFITIDPRRDTPKLLKEYMTHFGENFVALTGTDDQLRAATKSFRVHRRKVIADKTAPEDYLVDHSSITFLMGPDGKFRTLFPHDTTGDVMAKRMAKYLTQK
jgi:cytochrome oxidase Cu insertion factor (SCO1/SenC/PrrC family)